MAACTAADWSVYGAQGVPTARHEASRVAHSGRLYLIGGRRINPVDVFDPATGRWAQMSKTPLEIHHFQAVSLGDAIYILGAMTGPYPDEVPLGRVIKYYPADDRFEYGDPIPESRRRGGAGAVVYDGRIYVVGGITDGHRRGFRPWFDEYDPSTGRWRTLPDAPNARDHFQAVVVDDKLYAFVGRRTSLATGQPLDLTVRYGNVYDFGSGRWEPVTGDLAIPTPRAGNMAIGRGDKVIVAGGESATQVPAHREVEVFDTAGRVWQTWPGLVTGRHGSGLAIVGDTLYTAAGSGNRGGEPELTTLERIRLPVPAGTTQPGSGNDPVIMRWHTLTLPFHGPTTSESAADNPFTDYRLLVRFEHADVSYTVRGYYAADGDAANTGADSGNVWQVRFTPDRDGDWRYRAELRTWNDIAIDDRPDAGEPVPLDAPDGRFLVVPSDKVGRDFRAHGRLAAANGHYRFRESGRYWLKGGANSPENLLAYADFDATYAASAAQRDGEAVRDGALHRYTPHLADWRAGDPSWGGGRGKALVGAVNYLAATGMNAAYFLTLNVNGDGNDVWPYTSPEATTRFDVSKLAQWEIVFRHMQAEGILLHVVTQETENERLLDDGDTGRLRKLYYGELIARFGHHLALVWNLGEENGPAEFSPHGQTDVQRAAMAGYFDREDPYGHPVVIHTHADAHSKRAILSPLLGLESLDGLSFQVDERERINAEIAEWRRLAAGSGRDWVITMDEVGQWHTGALTDETDPQHDSLRRHALWGALLGGAAGVEWYFGARSPANDLNSENWRLRARLWELTRIALDFFSGLRYWEYAPCNEQLGGPGYCAGVAGQRYAIYSFAGTEPALDLHGVDGRFQVQWYDPLTGGDLRAGTVQAIRAGGPRSLGRPPYGPDRDWTVLLTRLP
ncbi:MAG: DUF5060 domain-containing protein [Pseudomonadota bacterium]